ncbi:MAG: glycosyltransferase [Actinomycetota bacterium]|nr:glycosyltransferase [Actinomycetota bacterium]MDI6821821.1 glycosyltransferase [Actinomycetota bacterium]
MQVLMINKLYYPVIGGVENHLYLLCNELKKCIDVRVLVCNTELKTVIEKLDNLEIIRVASAGILFSMPLGFTFPLWLRRLEADIIHFHHPFPLGEISYLLTCLPAGTAKPKGKIVITWHSDIIHQKHFLKFYEPFLLKLLERADRILPTSANYIESSPFLRRFRNKCQPIPLGIGVAQFKLTPEIENAAARIREKYGSKILLFIGRLVYYKGVEYLIEAMKYIDAHLIIIGEGPLENKLKALAYKEGVTGKISFLKPVRDEELPHYYYACDVFVLPSVARSEGFGIVQLEAMVCGKPVVSTNLPTGVPFVNQHQRTGLVVPPKDVRALAEAINTLLKDPDLCKKYGEYGKKRVEREFTKEIVAQRVLEVYGELI